MFETIRNIWRFIRPESERHRIHEAINRLHNLTKLLNYYMDSGDFRKHVLQDAIYIEEVLHEEAKNKRVTSMKFVKSLRQTWHVDELEHDLEEMKKKLRDLESK